MKKNKFLVVLSAVLGFVTIASVSTTAAWFTYANNIKTNDSTNGIKGSVLTQYFHCGKGKVDDPYIITRPIHWRNLVWLHNNVSNFWHGLSADSVTDKKGFYFEIGCPTDRLYDPSIAYDSKSTDEKYVFTYTDSGTVSTTPSKVLNLKSLNDTLIPIGSPEQPFVGSLVGHNVTVSNFTISSAWKKSGTTYAVTDIGVFGYTGNNASLKNLYFDNVTIDTTGNTVAHSEVIPDPSSSTLKYVDHIAHGKHNHEKHAYIGYIAGHAYSSKCYSNVYVNNCTIKGKNGGNGNLDNYGYFGLVDYDNNDGKYGTGQDYSFTLDSSAVYNYLSSRYNEGEPESGVSTKLKDQPMMLRNSGYADEDDINQHILNEEVSPAVGQFPVSNGITTGGDWISGTGYDLLGTNSSTASDRNYSLSTMGYYGAKYYTEVHNDKVYYKDDKGNFHKIPSQNLEQTTVKMEDMILTEAEAKNGKFYRYFDTSTGKWKYYECYKYDDTTNRKLTIKIPRTYKWTTALRAGEFDHSDDRLEVFIYIDDKEDYHYDYQAHAYAERRSYDYYCELKSGQPDTYTFTLPAGYHTIGVEVKTTVNWKGQLGSHNELTRHYASGGSISNNVIGGLKVDMRTADYEWDVSGGLDSKSQNTYSRGDFGAYTHYIHDYSGHTSIGMYELHTGDGYNGKTYTLEKDYGAITVQDVQWRKDDFIYNEKGEVVDFNYYAYYSSREVVAGTAGAHFIAGANNQDNPDDPDNVGNQIYESGYRYKNIDIVGGKVNFGSSYISLQGVSSSQVSQLSPVITSSDIGKKFYAPKYACSSVVLYLQNTGGSRPEDYMGKIDFYYGLSLFGSSIKEPSFRGAKGDYYGFDDFAAAKTAGTLYEETDYVYNGPTWLLDLDRSASIVLRRDYIKKCSYCALDKNGNILCGYDRDGSEVGATGVKEKDIYSYVLIFSVVCLSSIFNTRVQKIVFDYKAIAGDGGTFGTVGYRSATDTISATILNFYVLVPAIVDDVAFNCSYYIYVSYDDEQKLYSITFKASSQEISMNIFIYQPDDDVTYKYSVNGGEATDQRQNMNVSPASL